MLDLFLLM